VPAAHRSVISIVLTALALSAEDYRLNVEASVVAALSRHLGVTSATSLGSTTCRSRL